MDSFDERIVTLVTNSTNRRVLTILEAKKSISVSELADRIITHETGLLEADAYESELERLLLSLHHKRLPELDEAGLLEYDRTTNTVTGRPYVRADGDWTDPAVFEELFDRLSSGGQPCTLLEGREAVYDYTRTLADQATSELFLIYPSVELLDEDCLPAAEAAIDRGVDFHAGAKSTETRAFFETNLPEATVWEPQLDWLYDRSSCPTISRLVLADRETVVVGLWTEDQDGSKTETAMVGEGTTNPLVVLIRELLGPRLDHLDYQSDDFVDHLPFEP